MRVACHMSGSYHMAASLQPYSVAIVGGGMAGAAAAATLAKRGMPSTIFDLGKYQPGAQQMGCGRGCAVRDRGFTLAQLPTRVSCPMCARAFGHCVQRHEL